MIRKLLKPKQSKSSKFNQKIDAFVEKYKIPKRYLHINRRLVSKGVLVGLMWGFIPMPMQMLAVALTTPFVKFNVPIALAMVWLSNPLTMPAMYYMEYLTGNFILGIENAPPVEMTLEWFQTNIGNIFIPLYVGTAFYVFVIAPLVYLLVNWLWIHSVKSERKAKNKK
jgi:uncharacterized protein (DUF2062 family)